MKITSVLSVFLCLVLFLCGCTEHTSPQNTETYGSAVSSKEEASQVATNEILNENSSSEEPPSISSSQEKPKTYQFSFSQIPAYSGKAFVVLNDGNPVFSKEELSAFGIEKYTPLDAFGRCGVAFAVCGKEIMPPKGEKRGSISHIKPSGWVQAKYDSVNGKYLYNRCHLLGWQLSAENDNARNLITGTRYMNTEGMLPFENMIADYIKETENHVAYRVTPRFQNEDLVAKGVELEAYSIEDNGEGICFHVYVYNVQPNITINYATGKSKLTPSQKTESKVSSTIVSSKTQSKVSSIQSKPSQGKTVYITPTGKRYHYSSSCGGKNSSQSDLNTAKSLGLTPCKKCAS